MSTLLYLLGTAVLILLNAFFVASEFAIVKIRPTRLEQLVQQGDGRARLALRITQRLDQSRLRPSRSGGSASPLSRT